ncbi:MAG: hypothetical protein ACRDOO_16175 [Actinomadura sp.]
MTSKASGSSNTRIYLVICGLVSLIVGLVAAMLKRAAGANLAEATLTGGAAFTGSMGLCLGILHAANPR